MDRREFIGVVAVSLLAAPLATQAQQAGRVYRLGILAPTSMPAPSERRTAVILIPSALQELGYVQGQNLIVETRYGEGRLDRLPALARELVQLRPDVIVAIGAAAARAVKNTTATIPIVLYANIDPVAAGLVKSLAKPGDNITGILIAPAGTLAAKRLELLKQAVPRAERITFLGWGDDPSSNRSQVQETQEAASSLGVKLSVVEVRGGDYDRAFATIAAERPGALFVAATTYFVRDRKRIIELVAKHRLPAIYEWPEHVEDGGLMSYGSSLTGTTQRVAAYVDRVFKGAKPGDLPIEQPTRFELVINRTTARALGLTLPPSLVGRADRIIE